VGLALLPLGCVWSAGPSGQAGTPYSDPYAVVPIESEGSAGDDTDVARLRAQRDRLAVQNRQLREEVDQLTRRLRAAEQRAAAADSGASSELEAREAELARALEAVARAREEWEGELAAREREIDVLKNHLSRLVQELEEVRHAGQADTQPE
jgi:chromosome segregation ATPase